MFAPNQEGIFHGLAEELYRSAPGISNTALKYMERSPAHYRQAIETPWEATPAQVFGHIVHASILEPHRTGLHVVRPEGLSFQTKDGKAWRDAQTAPIITREEATKIAGVATAVWAHPIAREIIERSEKEVSAFRQHPQTGLWLKGRADLVFHDDDDIMTVADIKTCDDASLSQFTRDATKWAYYRQAAYYLDLFSASNFVFIAVEKSAPYALSIFQYSAEAIKAGRALYERNLKTLSACLASDQWPGYSEEITVIGVSSWVVRNEESAQ